MHLYLLPFLFNGITHALLTAAVIMKLVAILFWFLLLACTEELNNGFQNVIPFTSFGQQWTLRIDTKKYGSHFIAFFASDDNR